MNFLAPWFLLGAAAVAFPVLFHLVRRTTRDRLPFSSLMFLRPHPPRLSRRSRIEHWLLLLLRALALVLLALGFARPFLMPKPAAAAAAVPALRRLVLVDVSASMQRPPLWNRARRAAERTLTECAPGDQAALWLFDRQARPLLTFEEWRTLPLDERLPQVRARLEAVRPGWAETRLDAALIQAAEAVADQPSAPVRREVVLVSDLQEGARLNGLQAHAWPEGVALRILPVEPDRPGNAGLAQAGAIQPGRDGGPPVLRVRVQNDAASTVEAFELRWLNAAGRPVGEPVAIQAPPGQDRIVRLAVPDITPPPNRVHLTGDPQPFDNDLWVVPPAKTRIGVLYLGQDVPARPRSTLFFLQQALQTSDRLDVELTAQKPEEPLDPVVLENCRLIVVAAPLSGSSLDRVLDRAERGATALFVGVDPSGPTAEAAQAPGTPADALLGTIDFSHPLFAPFADPRFSDFTKLRFHRRIALDEPPESAGARVVARFDDGTPALIETPRGRGRVLALASGWSTDASNWALSTKFVPWLFALLQWSRGGMSEAVAYTVGEPLPLPEGRATAATMRLPDGSTRPVPPEARSFAGTEQPGLYRLSAGDLEWIWAVNLDPAESRTAPLAPGELEAFGAPASDASAAIRTVGAGALPSGPEIEARQKLWRWLLAAALGVILL
ncbi:MAG: VWA domain-containing protein, partial [Verrucomicrobia bacterium]